MFIDVLPRGGKSALELLKGIETMRNFYLAGGTGLALHLGHRISGDLDFFCQGQFETTTLRDSLIATEQFKVLSEAQDTLHGVLAETKVSFLRYPYQLLFPTEDLEGLKVADTRDIAVMKIAAISSRGSKKDFVDLYFVCQIYPMESLWEFFEKKYRQANYSRYHILKSLVFFDDADREPDPVMLKPWNWEHIKGYFREMAATHLNYL